MISPRAEKTGRGFRLFVIRLYLSGEGFNVYDQYPGPVQQSSVEPCGALLSVWGNPFPTPKASLGQKEGGKKRQKKRQGKKRDQGKMQSLGGGGHSSVTSSSPPSSSSSAPYGGVVPIFPTLASQRKDKPARMARAIHRRRLRRPQGFHLQRVPVSFASRPRG